jgi:DinB superfamily
MADLLECLLQIKGLRETMDRIAALVAGVEPNRWSVAPTSDTPTAGELLAQLADLELLYGGWLRQMAGSPHQPVLQPVEKQTVAALSRFRRWTAADALDRFLRRRRDNLELLDACTAEDLARVATHPVRRKLTVADVVATMLASDFDGIAEIRRAML